MEPIVVPTPPDANYCCGEMMMSVGSGYAANFEIGLWRCFTCEDHRTTFVWVGGQKFWVAAMGRAIRAEELRLIAAAYDGSGSS